MRDLDAGLHAVRGSLAVIRGQCFSVARAERDAPGAQSARVIDAEVDRILREIERIAGRDAEPAAAPRRVRSVIAEVVLRHLPAAERSGIALRMIKGAGDPGLDGAAADTLRLALDNLVQNAIRHCDPDGEITISLAASRHGNRVIVRNDGDAPSESELKTVFAPGERGSRPRGDGWGLGLAIASREVASCGGSVTAHPVVGGCAFAIDLPGAGV